MSVIPAKKVGSPTAKNAKCIRHSLAAGASVQLTFAAPGVNALSIGADVDGELTTVIGGSSSLAASGTNAAPADGFSDHVPAYGKVYYVVEDLQTRVDIKNVHATATMILNINGWIASVA